MRAQGRPARWFRR